MNPPKFTYHILAMLLCGLLCWSGPSQASQPNQPLKNGNESLSFTPNRGQVADPQGRRHPEVRYTTQAGGMHIFLQADRISYQLTEYQPHNDEGNPDNQDDALRLTDEAPKQVRTYRADLEFVGANPDPMIVEHDPQPGVMNYYLGHCMEGITHVPRYGQLTWRNVWPGIDIIFRPASGNAAHLEYDFVVHPGADPSQIRLRWRGDASLKIYRQKGNLLAIKTPLGTIHEHMPLTYQTTADGQRTPVPCQYALNGNEIQFQPRDFDPRKPLVIDPVIWARVFNENNFEGFEDLARDGAGNLITTGSCGSAFFLPGPGLIAHNAAITRNGLVMKFDALGNLTWATYYSGNGRTDCFGVDLDAANNIYVVGITEGATSLPMADGGGTLTHGVDNIQTIGAGTGALFVTRLNPNGQVQWSSMVQPASGTQYMFASTAPKSKKIAVDNAGNAYIVGQALGPGTGTQLTPSRQLTPFGPTNLDRDGAVVAFQPNGRMNWVQHFGSNGVPVGLNRRSEAITVRIDQTGTNLYVGGHTTNTAIPVTDGSVHPSNGNAYAEYVVSYTAATGNRRWATVYGSTNYNIASGLYLHPGTNRLYVCGYTINNDNDYPLNPTTGPYAQINTDSDSEATLNIMNPANGARNFSGIIWSGDDDQEAFRMELGQDGLLYFLGFDEKGVLTTTDGTQWQGRYDMYIAGYDITNLSPEFVLGSYLGSPLMDYNGAGFVPVNSSQMFIATGARSEWNIQDTQNGTRPQDGEDYLLMGYNPCGAPEPDRPSTINSIVDNGGGSVTLNLTAGNGNGRMIIVRPNGLAGGPLDNQTYTGINSNFAAATDQGNGNRIVYEGTGNSVTVTGLSCNTAYYFAVYEYNGLLQNCRNYNTTAYPVENVLIEPVTVHPTKTQLIACQGSGVSYQLETSQPGVTYNWSFPGGTPTTATGAGPHTVAYTNVGNYSAQVTATKAGCPTAQAQFQTTVRSRPQARFTAPVGVAGCTDQALAFQTDPLPGHTYTWQFGNNATGFRRVEGPGPHIQQWSTPGTYLAALTVSDGVCASDFAEYIPINAQIGVGIQGPDRLCVHRSGVFQPQTEQENVFYAWTFEGSTVARAESAGPHSIRYLQPGIYEVKVVAHRPGCRPQTATRSVEVSAEPNLNFSTETQQVCGNTSTSFFVPQRTGIQYTWRFSGATPNAASGPGPHNVVWPQTGRYTVEVKAEGGLCGTVRTGRTVEVHAPPAPYAQEVAGCGNGRITITAIHTDPQVNQYRLYTQAAGGGPIAAVGAAPWEMPLSGVNRDTTFFLEAVSNGNCPNSARYPVRVRVIDATKTPQPVHATVERCGPGPVTLYVDWGEFAGNEIRMYVNENDETPRWINGQRPALFPIHHLEESHTYYVSGYYGGFDCETPKVGVPVMIHELPPAPTVETLPTVCMGQPLKLGQREGLGGTTGSRYHIFASETGGSPLVSGDAGGVESPTIQAHTTYWLGQESEAGCHGPRSPLDIHPLPRPASPRLTQLTPSVCAGGAVQLVANNLSSAPGSHIRVYDAPDGRLLERGTGAEVVIEPVRGHTPYFFTQVEGITGCESRSIHFQPQIDTPIEVHETDILPLSGTVRLRVGGGSGQFVYRLSNGMLNTSGVFTGLAPGTYTVEIRDVYPNACGVVNHTFTIPQQEARQDRDPEAGAISVYPNPTTGEVTASITVSRPGSVRLTLRTLQGRELMNTARTLGAGTHTIAFTLEACPAGLYLLEVDTPEGTTQTKIRKR